MTRLVPLALVTTFLASCSKQGEEPLGGGDLGPTIAVVNYPLAYFADRLAGDFATVVFEAPADEDPAFWKPTAEEISRYQQAELIFLNGATYAKWTSTASLPFETTVDTSASFASDLIKVEGGVKHTHGDDEDAHSHAGVAFTTWLDFRQAAAQASAMAEALQEEWPDQKDAIAANLDALQTDLEDLDEAMKAAARKLHNAPVLASHPVYQYWARAYGVNVTALLWEPEMNLDESALTDLKKSIAENPGAKYFLWEGEPAPGHREKLGTLGLTSLVFSPCGNRPETDDFLSVMKANLAALEQLPPPSD